jgi:hypothetical protein
MLLVNAARREGIELVLSMGFEMNVPSWCMILRNVARDPSNWDVKVGTSGAANASAVDC